MADVDPAIVAERLLRLKCTPPFEALDTRSLSVLASAGRELVCSTRTQLAVEGERASAHWVALTGKLRVLHRGEELYGGRLDGFGGLSLLSELPLPVDLFADAGTVLFVLDADTLLETLEAHSGLARAVLRAMTGLVLDARRRERSAESSEVTVHDGAPDSRLDLVSRMMMLRAAIGLPIRNGVILDRLARVARVVRLPPGRSLWSNPAAPADLVVVVEGGLDRRPDGEARDDAGQGRGLVYGLMEAVASVPPISPVITTCESTALVVSHAEIREALEDDDRICIALIRLAALDLWRAFWREQALPGG